ncbi:MAG: hypothetical protein E6J76_13645 [Deltaproteobacteria bacterium]|nr:MAG: hypothetical protein E6J76_13645 [Deltaproteobacteria bacterium]
MSPAHIRVLLDADGMRPLLGTIPLLADGTARLTAVSLDRLWVKPGRHFHASYRVTLATETGPLETQATASLLRSIREAASPMRLAPRESRVPAATRWDVERSTALVESPPLLLHRSCTVVGYWPGIRCQLRYERADEPGVLYGKVFPDGAGSAAGRVQHAIARRGESAAFQTPRPRAYLPELNLLLTEPVEGEPLLDLLRAAPSRNVVGRVATALAAFHALGVPEVDRRFGPADDLAIVRAWVPLIGGIFPRLASPLGSALAGLERAAPHDAVAVPALVHRDFYDKQVLVGTSTIGFLDLDTVCQGDGEIDVGNFCAHLVLRALQAGISTEAAERLGEVLVASYRAARPAADPRRVAWYRASALLRLACVYALRPWWHGLAPTLIDESRRTLEA